MKIVFVNLFTEIYFKIWDWVFGDWGLGIGPNPQSPIPNPHFKIKVLIIKL